MNWYCALTEHLLIKSNIIEIGNESFEAILHQLEERVIALYKALLLYQMKSVCSYYQIQGLNYLRGLLNFDDWDADLNCVTDAEDALQRDSAQYIQVQTKTFLATLVQSAEGMKTQIGDIRQDIREFIALQKQIQIDDKDTECLRDLFVVDPQVHMKEIERNKDTLLDDAYKWILDTQEYATFTHWSNNGSALPSCRLMWVKGHAGTGKTMLLIGIIRELSDQPAALAPSLSYFFCQGTGTKKLNSATAAIRSLIWMLLVQQPHLISHLQSKHKYSGSSLFTDASAFDALYDAFRSMLKDPGLSPVYFIVDALDECEQGLAELVTLISTSLTDSDKVRWLVSSRPVVELNNPDTARNLVELDAQRLKDPVNAYIKHKLSTLRKREGYDEDILAEVSSTIRERAMNTFLWVALVFKELDTEDDNLNPLHGAYALDTIKGLPSGLSKLYDYMMNRIEKGKRDPQYCKNVLMAAVLAYRPLTLPELAVLAGLPPNMHARTIVRKCGSFLTITGQAVTLIHQSAKDYLEENYISTGVAQGHVDNSKRSIDAMFSMLKQNMYALLDFGFKPKDIRPPDPDPLAPIRYSCVFWADHLCFLNGESSECKRELMNDERVFRFLKERFLQWLESLSLLGKLSDGVLSIRKLLCVAQVCLWNCNCIKLLNAASHNRL